MNHYPPLTPSALFVDVDQAYMGNSMCDGCWAMPNMGLNLQHFFAFEYRHTRNALSTPISLECQQKNRDPLHRTTGSAASFKHY